ncbi:RING-H2 finger protein ATL46-like [Impatiens glandulifera]|uniref:RING-H2 finger protein ATL46-like n=1 Tax=Impatiens glandulifera TaxID=253017 RepID=UPI001FB14AD9|nr:RING-H2 finger protein ATL46-like [Impatiens glandulifera]
MRRIQSEISSSSPSSLPSPFPHKEPSSKISPALIIIIVIVSVLFFIAGLLHLLLRFLIKHRSSSPTSDSGRYPEMSGTDTVQRQLQQLFHQHDSGLDQSFIDSLPVFMYKEIKGLKEPFDCAVCLCEFSDRDKLRLLPLCSHAFHIDCIDTWLQSNSTCPLCRGNLFTQDFSIEENPCFDFEQDELRGEEEEDGVQVQVQFSSSEREIVNEKRVFPVRLGKFKSTTNVDNGDGETSSSDLGARRCYSMGSFQYVVQNSELQVILRRNNNHRAAAVVNGGSMRLLGKTMKTVNNCNSDIDGEGKRINSRIKGDSFSVSKIWLWSKKGKFPTSSETLMMANHNHQDPSLQMI